MNLPSIGISQQNINVLLSPKSYKETLLRLIAEAQARIYITALYLQDDQAGREVLTALYQAKEKSPHLDICLFVDAHRAQRGLIGEEEQLGNRAMYLAFAKKHSVNINILGITVKSKEFLGVLHLKGIVIDDTLLYSGASINNVYLHHENKYRLDRYYQFKSANLANSFQQYLQRCFIDSKLAIDLTSETIPTKKQQKVNSKKIKSIVRRARYDVDETVHEHSSLNITPLAGCGQRNNLLNNAICRLIKNAQTSITLFTPYFNLPRAVKRQITLALKRGVKITIIIGDKTASDFYIANPDKFSTIGIIPYIYEQILQGFVKRWQKLIDAEQLIIKLWQDGENSYHLKGLVIDEENHLVTGSNLNPRAWGLDLENGLLISDVNQHLLPDFHKELAIINQHTTTVKHYQEIDGMVDYPVKVKKLLTRLKLSNIDKILKRFL